MRTRRSQCSSDLAALSFNPSRSSSVPVSAFSTGTIASGSGTAFSVMSAIANLLFNYHQRGENIHKHPEQGNIETKCRKTPGTSDLENEESSGSERQWLSDMDSNHDKSLQRALCYHYTIGQYDAPGYLIQTAPIICRQ